MEAKTCPYIAVANLSTHGLQTGNREASTMSPDSRQQAEQDDAVLK
jgi:hypothetical protein